MRFLTAFFVMILAAPTFAQVQASRPTVVVSVPVLAMIVRELAAQEVDLHLLLAGNSSPHDYAMKFSDRKALASAARVFWIGPGLETFLAGPLQSQARAVALFPSLPETQAHIWFSPAQTKDAAQRIAQELVRLLPGQRDLITDRLAVLLAQIDAASRQLQQQLLALREVQLIAGHDAYAALTTQFGLRPVHALLQQVQSSATAQRVATLEREIAAGGQYCVIEERNHPVAVARRLAQRHHLPLVALDVYGAYATSYPQWLQTVGDAFASCVVTLE